MKKWFSIALLGLALFACSTDGKSPAKQLTLVGKLVLMGNEPFVFPCLQLDSGQFWELGGVTRSAAEKLQNRRIEVFGTEVRPAGVDPNGPKIEVEKLNVRN